MAKELQPISKGISQDFNQEFQPEGTYTFMLNGMIESTEGERGGLVNERGNRIILSLPTNIGDPNLIGHCLLPNQDKVLFLVGNDGQQEIQIIGLHRENNTWQELIRTNCLEFSRCDQVDCIFKVHNGCEIIIYFTDHKNRYKSINISSITGNTNRYETINYTDYLGGSNPNVPTVNPTIGIGDYGWECNSFALTPISLHPSIYYHNEGLNGNLRTGTYTFFVRLLDLDLNPTDWLTWTNPITVKNGTFNFTSPPDNNDNVYVDPTAENFVSKSITLILNNLDTSFQYYEIGVIERSLNTNTPNFVYRTGQRLLPPSGNSTFVFNTVSDSRFTPITIASILTRTRRIDVVNAHTQINNRLILGNLSTTAQDWAQYQRAANNIRVEYFTYNEVDISNQGCGTKKHFVASGPQAVPSGMGFEGVNYSSPEFLSYGMSLMRDEVYALGIIYVFNDGTESPVFHIPGRMKYSTNGASDAITDDIIGGFDYAQYALQSLRSLSDSTLDSVGGATLSPSLINFDNNPLTVSEHTAALGTWASNRLTNLPQDNVLANVQTDEYKYLFGYKDTISCCYNIPISNNNCSSTDLQRWQYYNTAIRRKSTGTWNSIDDQPTLSGSNPAYTFSGGFRGVPGYFDTGIPYPDILDCEGNRIFPSGNVRHHKMPDHRIEQLFDKQGGIGVGTVTGTGLTTNAAWRGTSNITTNQKANPAANDWQMNDSEGTLKLYPLGLNFHNVSPPEEFRDQISGYYIVRSDRTNNETVIDKGFMNVSDTSISIRNWANATLSGFEAIDNFTDLDDNEISPNNLLLTSTHKPTQNRVAPDTRDKNVVMGWWNIMELHTPKSTYNDITTLSADYIKLEATLFGDLFFDSDMGERTTREPNSYVQVFPRGTGNVTGWNGGMSLFLNQHKYPRVQSSIGRDRWAFVYNIPISGLSYGRFNSRSSTNLLGGAATTLDNARYQQRTLFAKHFQSCTPSRPASSTDTTTVFNAPPYSQTNQSLRSVCDVSFPFYYNSLKVDILDDNSNPASSRLYLNGIPFGTVNRELSDLMAGAGQNTGIGSQNGWARNTNVTDIYKWSFPFSSYMYYIGLKSSQVPYQDFDSIRYIKMHSYLIPSSDTVNTNQTFPVTGGDTFINRFQFEKGYYDIPNDRIGNPIGNENARFVSSMVVGYVESEINSAFRYLQQGDLFRSFPYDERNAYYGFLSNANDIGGSSRDELDALMARQEITYRYKIDYSSYNSEVISPQLLSTFNYCSTCTDSFPNTLFYSEVSLDSQIQDFYKLFLVNSTKEIPSYTGSIQNLFVKNSDLYVHTEHNLWKLSVAPQQIETNADVVEVGQGAFLGRDPIRTFNNEDAYSRGGIVDKFTSIFGLGQYIWLDRNSGKVFSLTDRANVLSDNGLTRWFDNNTELILNSQFRTLTTNNYPFLGTSCNQNVGYIATLDPEHFRYILTKRDYRLLPAVIDNINELTTNANGDQYVPAVVVGTYYYDNEGFYVGISAGSNVSDKATLLGPIDYTNRELAENKSWTISYSLQNQSWTSWHSYIPNWTYYDSHTFYSFIENDTNDINLSIWEHNFGNFQSYYGVKADFIIDYIYKKNPYSDKTFDSIEYTSSVWSKETTDNQFIEIPFSTFDSMYVYNNNQISNKKTISISNNDPYANVRYSVTEATAHKWRNIWRINRLRDQSVGRLNLTQPKFTQDWSQSTYQSQFNNGYGYIDKVINPSIIDTDKNVYQIERLTDKYLGVRLFYNPTQDYKITFNILSGIKRNKF